MTLNVNVVNYIDVSIQIRRMLRGRGRQGWLNKRRQSGQTDWWASNDVNNCRADSKIVYPTAHAPLNR